MSRTYTILTNTHSKHPKVLFRQYHYENSKESKTNLSYNLQAELEAELLLANSEPERRRVLNLSRQVRSR